MKDTTKDIVEEILREKKIERMDALIALLELAEAGVEILIKEEINFEYVMGLKRVKLEIRRAVSMLDQYALRIICE